MGYEERFLIGRNNKETEKFLEIYQREREHTFHYPVAKCILKKDWDLEYTDFFRDMFKDIEEGYVKEEFEVKVRNKQFKKNDILIWNVASNFGLTTGREILCIDNRDFKRFTKEELEVIDGIDTIPLDGIPHIDDFIKEKSLFDEEKISSPKGC